jgi:serine/threonine-protein kinase
LSPSNAAVVIQSPDLATLPPEAAAQLAAHPLPLHERPSVMGFKILDEIGRGGMGVVYKAEQIGLNRLVALKMILAGGHAGESELARFQTEAQAIARLHHTNIVQVYEIGSHDGMPFLALELCDGGSLEKKVQKQPLSVREAVQLVQVLALAMHHAHEHNVIHRDLKPANILLAEDGTPKITDFGLAKKLDDSGLTQPGQATMGTPSYMAPEQAGGKLNAIGPGVDIYALGAILYELLTGRPPFKAATPLDTMLQVISEEPVSPRRLQPRLPRSLEAVCLKCLHKDRSQRYESAQALADDLGRYLRGESVLARPPSLGARLFRWASDRLAFVVTLFGLLVFVLNYLVVGSAALEAGLYYVLGVVAAWIAGAFCFQALVRNRRWRTPATYCWAALDVLMLTALLLGISSPNSGLVVGYLLLIAASGLRGRSALVWLVTCLSMAGFLSLQMAALLHWPDHEQALMDRLENMESRFKPIRSAKHPDIQARFLAEEVKHHKSVFTQHAPVDYYKAVFVTLSILFMGLTISLLVRRIRLTPSEEP